VSKMKIAMDEDNKKNAFRRNYMNCTSRGRLFSPIQASVLTVLSLSLSLSIAEFKYNAEMALRVACGVIIASFIQTKDQDYDPNVLHDKRWFFFPRWYYLGGLSYCAVAVIFSAQKTVGATTREMCQAFYGVGMALVYNIILFSIVDVHKSSVAIPTGPIDGFVEITKNFGTSAYYVNPHNFYTVLPWIMIFTVVILLLPIETNTKKFALGNNLYFCE
jgi:hypothetical protein